MNKQIIHTVKNEKIATIPRRYSEVARNSSPKHSMGQLPSATPDFGTAAQPYTAYALHRHTNIYDLVTSGSYAAYGLRLHPNAPKQC